MNKPFLLLLLLGLIIFSSCSKSDDIVSEPVLETENPLVDFEIVPGDDPFTFDFKNNSSKYEKLEWRFGDDSLSTEVSPKHIYATAGLFQVNLEATSADGSKSRKLLEINIPIDSVVKLSSLNTDAKTLKFKVDSKANIKSLLWTFEDKSTSESLTPSRSYNENTLNNVKVVMTTDKGSIVENNKFATTKGIVTDITNIVSLQSVSKENGGGANSAEGSLKIIDNNVDTKIYLPGWGGSFFAQFKFEEAQTIKYYGIGSGNDGQDRDPKTWTLQGSNDGQTWETVDSESIEKNFYDQTGGKFKQMFYFGVDNPKAYIYYKWNVSANFGSGDFQISEFKLFK